MYVSSGRNITRPFKRQAVIMDRTGVKAYHCAVVNVDHKVIALKELTILYIFNMKQSFQNNSLPFQM